MGTLNITEFSHMARAVIGGGQAQIAPLPGVTASQDVTTSGTSAQSAAFQANTTYIRVVSDTAERIRVGDSPAAVATDTQLPANSPEYFAVGGGQKLASIND